jgi:hypothetical protein
MLIAPAYAWFYNLTGDVSYLQKGDQIFNGGVAGAWLGGGKQFSQNYRWSFQYVEWAGAGFKPAPIPTPTPTPMPTPTPTPTPKPSPTATGAKLTASGLTPLAANTDPEGAETPKHSTKKISVPKLKVKLLDLQSRPNRHER